MKRKLPLLIMFIFLCGMSFYVYSNVDKSYHLENDLNDFPVPNNARLESENKIAQNYRWESSTGTEVPFLYKMMIKKSGWKQVEIDGHNVMYTKKGRRINLTLAPDYIGIIKE